MAYAPQHSYITAQRGFCWHSSRAASRADGERFAPPASATAVCGAYLYLRTLLPYAQRGDITGWVPVRCNKRVVTRVCLTCVTRVTCAARIAPAVNSYATPRCFNITTQVLLDAALIRDKTRYSGAVNSTWVAGSSSGCVNMSLVCRCRCYVGNAQKHSLRSGKRRACVRASRNVCSASVGAIFNAASRDARRATAPAVRVAAFVTLRATIHDARAYATALRLYARGKAYNARDIAARRTANRRYA